MGGTLVRTRLVVISMLLAGMAFGSSSGHVSAAGAAPTDPCLHPTVPDWFHDDVVTAINISGDLPSEWIPSHYIAKVACWQGANFDSGFSAHGDAYHDWHGIFAMTVEEMETIAGPWMIRDKDGFKLTAKCFVYGWRKCSRTTANMRTIQQLIAGMRWMWLMYGYPKAAWQHIVNTGRFTSYPRTGTDDTSTTTPLGRCPVDGTVSYSDDFGNPRYVGGYHPHSGNDVLAPRGRPIRAPFDGFAVAQSDDWFAGNYVSIVGAKGYVRNDHLDSFGTLGYVTAGTIVGYVGDTGDAPPGATHDHFEWHPWVVHTPLHAAPSGYRRINDAIDPFPFINQVCSTSAAPAAGYAGWDPAYQD